MIADLNRLVDHVETHLADRPDVADLAARVGTTEYHLRRMFSSLVGMSLSEYVRRRRMTVAAAELLGGARLLDVATASGYGSTEAFGRAFHAVHGVTPAEARRSGGPFTAQPKIRFRLTIEGNTTMNTRLLERPAFALVGRATRVPLIHDGVNPRIQEFIAALPPAEHARLKAFGDTEPAGLLQVTDGVDPDDVEGTELTYLHGVAVGAQTPRPEGLDVIEVPAGWWAVFRAAGPYPQMLQQTWAATATEWFPSNPWRLRPGPSIVAVLDRADDFSTATTELWLPVEAG